jgi:hypothetical protein
MRLALALPAALLLLLPLPAAAEVDARSAIIAAGRSGGCAITEAQAQVVFPALGLTQDQVREAAQAMIEAGEATGEGDTLRLSAALCDAGASPAPARSPLVETVLQVFRENGCLLSGAQALPLLAARGIDEAQVEAAEPEFEALIAAGTLVEVGDDTYRLVDPACPGAAPADLTGTPRERLVRLLAENGCAVDYADALPLLPSYGLSEDDAERESTALMEAGEATLKGDVLTLVGCTP